MRLLLVLGNSLLRDQVRVGLQAFGDIEIEEADGLLAPDKLRRHELDALLVALDPAAPENEQLLEQVRTESRPTEIIVFGHEAVADRMREDKLRGRIFFFFTQPLDPVEFFRTINRLRQKRTPARAR
jgi:DNA-binding NarL/FixJ family response regulator